MSGNDLLINLNVISSDVILFKMLCEVPFQATVHSVFTHVINIQTANGDLYTLACRDCDNAPNTAIVDASKFSVGWFIPGEMCVNIPKKSILNFSRVSIFFYHKMTWECILPTWPSHEFYLEIKIGLLKKILERQRKLLSNSLNGKTGQFLLDALTLLHRRADLLFYTLMQDKLDTALNYAVSMIGLGPGLTPSGDDFLVGLFAVLNIKNSPAYRFRELCCVIPDHVDGLTNPISLAAMKTAAHGRVRQSMVDLLHTLLNESDHLDETVLSRVLNIGSTSGTDILMGVLYGLKLNRRISAD